MSHFLCVFPTKSLRESCLSFLEDNFYANIWWVTCTHLYLGMFLPLEKHVQNTQILNVRSGGVFLSNVLDQSKIN